MRSLIILKKSITGAIILLPVLWLCSCQRDESIALSPLATLGKGKYMANCTACHNPNPRLAGSVGPAIAGPSLELITARIMHQTYPRGYKPKQNSNLMPPLPFLERDIPALHAFLNSF